jgi:hypothetical protein
VEIAVAADDQILDVGCIPAVRACKALDIDELELDRASDAGRGIALEGEHVGDLAVELVRPDRQACSRVAHPSVHPDLTRAPADASLDYVPRPWLAADLERIRIAAVMHMKLSSDDLSCFGQ